MVRILILEIGCNKKKKGFTLIEVLVVLVIIGITSSLLFLNIGLSETVSKNKLSLNTLFNYLSEESIITGNLIAWHANDKKDFIYIIDHQMQKQMLLDNTQSPWNGEMRDVETAQIGIQASLTGHLVLSTVHTNSAVAAITRLRDMGIESFLLASSLRTVISQRLVRRLCLSCKKEELPSKNSTKLFNLDTNKKVFTSSGCDDCSNTGYQGRIAIAECIQVDKTLKEMIHNNASENLISEHVFKNNQSIDEASSELISKGITSCEELIRINNLQENASI